jgi:hypothetical protein
MRVLILTLMMSFLSHSAFASEAGATTLFDKFDELDSEIKRAIAQAAQQNFVGAGAGAGDKGWGRFMTIQQEDEESFREAAWDGDVQKIKQFIQQGVNVNCVDEDGCTALMNAAHNGEIDILTLLLRAGANIYQGAEYNCTAIETAVFIGKTYIVKFLLSWAHSKYWDEKNGMKDKLVAIAEVKKNTKLVQCLNNRRIVISPVYAGVLFSQRQQNLSAIRRSPVISDRKVSISPILAKDSIW